MLRGELPSAKLTKEAQIMELIGRIIKQQLQLLDKSARQASVEAGLSNSYVAKLISGDRTPTAKGLQKLAPVLELPYEELMRAANLMPERIGEDTGVVIVPSEVLAHLTEEERLEIIKAAQDEIKRVSEIFRRYKDITPAKTK
jgi:transcriptional regulator with XRE-family HTH domain